MFSGLSAAGALLVVFGAIWLVIKVEHFVVRTAGFAAVSFACFWLVHVFTARGGL